jgi:hypothetical protein
MNLHSYSCLAETTLGCQAPERRLPGSTGNGVARRRITSYESHCFEVFVMAQGYVGEVRLYSGTRVPKGWLPCDGRLMPIAQYQVLYSVIGPLFGGDGFRTFALPDLRGRSPVGSGQGPDLPPIELAQQVGNTPVAPASGGTGVPTPAGLGLTFIIAYAGDYPVPE